MKRKLICTAALAVVIVTGVLFAGGFFGGSGRPLSLPEKEDPYERYDILTDQKQLCFFSGYRLPVYFGNILVREYTVEEKTYSKEEIKEIFEQKFRKLMQTLEEKGVQIIEKNVTIKKYKGLWKLKADFTVTQAAGTEKRTEPKSLKTDQGE